MEDFGELLGLNFVQGFASSFEFLEGFDDGFRHAIVGFGGASNDGELLTSC